MTTTGIGNALPRLEDASLLRGDGRFIDDVDMHRQLYMWVVRSPYAHARIVAVDSADAAQAPGVVAVFTGADLRADDGAAIHARLAVRGVDGEPARLPPRPVLATERVLHVGDGVAIVLAETAQAARDAAELVVVDYEALTALADAAAARADGAPRLHDDVPGNVALHWHGGDAAHTERAMESAHHVTRLRVVNNRVVVAPMETRGVVADYDAGSRRFTVYAPSQGANDVKRGLAAALGVPEADVHVLTPEVGGAFGMKILAYPEYVLAAWAARRLGRPVKWTGDRTDAFVSDGQARDHVMEAELALGPDGEFLAIRCRTLSNIGAYGCATACTIPTTGGTRCITGVYRVGTWHADVHVVYTNTVPVVAYRGAGKPEYNYLLERIIDKAAREIGIDPVSLRRRNVVPSDAMPFDTGAGLTFDSGEFARNMDRALELADRDGFDARRKEALGRGRLRGQGFALFQEPDGFLDNRVTVVFSPSGELTVTLTGQTGGQGFWTTFAQVACEQLGVPLESVRVRQGDSDLIGPGSGTGGSRTATVASVGIVRASETILDKARRIVAHMMEVDARDVEVDLADGAVGVVGTDRRLRIVDVARASFDIANLPDDMNPGLEASVHYRAREYNYPCGCHVCEVEVDPETGKVTLVDYAAVNDHGRAINPMLLDGQIHGGVVQGIGQALTERCVYDADGAQLLSGSFMDYCVPRADDLPSLRIVHDPVPAKTNPLGVKGVGESGCTAACPAVVNAIVDALSGACDADVDMPVTSEQIWRRLRATSA